MSIHNFPDKSTQLIIAKRDFASWCSRYFSYGCLIFDCRIVGGGVSCNSIVCLSKPMAADLTKFVWPLHFDGQILGRMWQQQFEPPTGREGFESHIRGYARFWTNCLEFSIDSANQFFHTIQTRNKLIKYVLPQRKDKFVLFVCCFLHSICNVLCCACTELCYVSTYLLIHI